MTMTRMVLGAMYFGTRLEQAASLRLLDCFAERGGGWIDTADCYAFWEDPDGVSPRRTSTLGCLRGE